MGGIPWFLLAASPVLSFVIYLIYKDDSDASNQRLMQRAVALAKARTGLKTQNYLGKMEVEEGGDMFSTRMVLAQQMRLRTFNSTPQVAVKMAVEAVRDHFWQSYAVDHVTLTAPGLDPVVIPINEVFDPQH